MYINQEEFEGAKEAAFFSGVFVLIVMSVLGTAVTVVTLGKYHANKRRH